MGRSKLGLFDPKLNALKTRPRIHDIEKYTAQMNLEKNCLKQEIHNLISGNPNYCSFVLQGELAKPAVSEGTIAVTRYTSRK